MFRHSFLLLSAAGVLALSIGSRAASREVVPTTTLKAETSNNTSAADSFKGMANDVPPPANTSKVDVHTLLYPGAQTKIYAHLMPWFGITELGYRQHVDVGYDSSSAEQVRRQVEAMASRGFDGVFIDWYGPNKTHHNNATLNVMREAEKHSGFEFAVIEDLGAIEKCANTPGCDYTQRMIDDINYAYRTYFSSPAYMRKDGRPVVGFFGVDKYKHDWTRVRNSVLGNPLFIFRQTSAYTHAQTNGGYAWVGHDPDPMDMALDYYDNFYTVAKRYPQHYTFAAGVAGFNNTAAPWAAERSITDRQCGQTWLATWGRINAHYSLGVPIESVQINTWNDYEEGSAIETGIENCVTVTAQLSGTELAWSITGQQNTIDHFKVYISADGENLMPIAELTASARSMDVEGLGFRPGDYKLFVQAVGRPMLRNKMSGAVPFAVVNRAPLAQLEVTPGSGVAPVVVAASAIASTDFEDEVLTGTIDFGDGNIVSGLMAEHTYRAAGTYTVTATVFDSLGASATKSMVVSVAPNLAPVAKLAVTPWQGYAPVQVSATTDGSSDPEGGTLTSTIDFGDGTVVSGGAAAHTYETAGTYTVTATVSDDYGNTTTAQQTVSVAPNRAPSALLSVTPSNGIAPVTVTASTTGSTDADGDALTSSIDFGDGTTLSGVEASHIYANAGSYIVSARITDERGNVTTTSKTVVVSANQPPVARLTVTPTSGTAPVTVTASTAASSDPEGEALSTTIDFGDGTVVNGASASHNYSSSGSYTVRATVTDIRGASASTSTTVTVTAPIPSGVTILSPADGATVTSPVRVRATAQSTTAIRYVEIYVDGKFVVRVTGSNIDRSVSMGKGSRRLTVRAMDEAGKLWTKTIYVTVGSMPIRWER